MIQFLSRQNYSPKLFHAAFLVAGTCIGGGMLALPVATSPYGFWPSILYICTCWFAMTLTGLLLAEAGFWIKKSDAHIISMSQHLLGERGKLLSILLYLFISYASLVAYTDGIGHITSILITKNFGIACTKQQAALFFTVLFGPIIMRSHSSLGRINAWLFYAMLVAYLLLIGTSCSHINPKLLLRTNWDGAWQTFPLILTAFSFQTIVPSLHSYLNHHGPSLRLSIIMGTTIALIFYIIWQVTAIGIIPFEGPYGLQSALLKGEAATHLLGMHLNSISVEFFAICFSFFAIVTSYLGMSMGLFDFLNDGLKMKNKRYGTYLLTLLILVPTLVSAMSIERIFLEALDMTGGIGDALLNGIIPVLMVWIGRYILGYHKSSIQLPFGKWLLSLIFFFYSIAFGIEVYMRHANRVSDTQDVIIQEYNFD